MNKSTGKWRAYRRYRVVTSTRIPSSIKGMIQEGDFECQETWFAQFHQFLMKKWVKYQTRQSTSSISHPRTNLKWLASQSTKSIMYSKTSCWPNQGTTNKTWSKELERTMINRRTSYHYNWIMRKFTNILKTMRSSRDTWPYRNWISGITSEREDNRGLRTTSRRREDNLVWKHWWSKCGWRWSFIIWRVIMKELIIYLSAGSRAYSCASRSAPYGRSAISNGVDADSCSTWRWRGFTLFVARGWEKLLRGERWGFWNSFCSLVWARWLWSNNWEEFIKALPTPRNAWENNMKPVWPNAKFYNLTGLKWWVVLCSRPSRDMTKLQKNWLQSCTECPEK